MNGTKKKNVANTVIENISVPPCLVFFFFFLHVFVLVFLIIFIIIFVCYINQSREARQLINN